VLLNLFCNAVKFTQRNGKITILVELLKIQAKHQIRVSVVDNGIGIKEKNHKRIFKMFGSIKDKKKNLNLGGIGLGLVISKLIVEKFDGKISFFSRYSLGSTFFFSFKTVGFSDHELHDTK
jgi:signal transduction histidine kinase